MSFVGKKLKMSFAVDKTGVLWRQFMPRRKEIENSRGTNLYSIEVYEPDFFKDFDPQKEFEKWAAVEIANADFVPDEMEKLALEGGLYAVFIYKGKSSEAAKMYRYIYGAWLPNSSYLLDDRPHFAKMGEKYKNNDPNSEEEIWIPVKIKK